MLEEKRLLESDIRVSALISDLLSAKYKIAFATALISIFFVWYALSLPEKYTSEAKLVAVDSESSGLSSLMANFDGLASLAGISSGSGGASETSIALATLQSWDFIESFIEKYDLSVQVYAYRGWNKELDQPIVGESLYDPVERVWVRSLDDYDSVVPTSWELYQRFLEFLTVAEDKKNGFVDISIEYYSPKIASEWLDLLIEEINHHMRSKDIKSSQKNIDYLNEQIEGTKVAGLRVVLFSLLEEQTKALMLAGGSESYAFEIVARPRVPEERSSPKRPLIAILGFLFGFFVSAFFVLVKALFRKNS